MPPLVGCSDGSRDDSNVVAPRHVTVHEGPPVVVVTPPSSPMRPGFARLYTSWQNFWAVKPSDTDIEYLVHCIDYVIYKTLAAQQHPQPQPASSRAIIAPRIFRFHKPPPLSRRPPSRPPTMFKRSDHHIPAAKLQSGSLIGSRARSTANAPVADSRLSSRSAEQIASLSMILLHEDDYDAADDDDGSDDDYETLLDQTNGEDL